MPEPKRTRFGRIISPKARSTSKMVTTETGQSLTGAPPMTNDQQPMTNDQSSDLTDDELDALTAPTLTPDS